MSANFPGLASFPPGLQARHRLKALLPFEAYTCAHRQRSITLRALRHAQTIDADSPPTAFSCVGCVPSFLKATYRCRERAIAAASARLPEVRLPEA